MNIGRIILLTRTLIRGSGTGTFDSDTQGKKKRLGKTGIILLLGFVFVYMSAISVMFAVGMYDILSPVGLESLIVTLSVSAASFMVFFFGLFYVMSVFYFSNDVVKILPLPFKPGEIIAAKFFTTLVYEYLLVVIMLLPAMVTYGILSGSPFLFYVYVLVTLLLLPVVPLILASIIIMLIMRFAPAARNKDRFTLISSLLALILGLGISFGFQAMMARTAEGDLAALLSKGAEGIARISSKIFPGAYFANYALCKPLGIDSFLMMLILAGMAALAFALLYFAANLLYFKGVIGITDAASRGRKLSGAEMAKTSAAGNAVGTYVLKELKILFRTPIFLMNNVLVNYLMPIVLLVPLVLGGESNSGDFSIAQIKAMISELMTTGDLRYAAYYLAGLFGFVTFTCGITGITETAISREGSCAYMMKIIPMSYNKQILAKILTGVLLSFTGAILIYAIALLLLAPPLWLALLSLAVLPGAVLFPNISGMIFDLYMPKIRWDNEQKAVKQNMNVIFGMIFSGISIAAVVIPIAVFSLTFAEALLCIIGIPLVLSAVSAVYVKKVTVRRMLLLAA